MTQPVWRQEIDKIKVCPQRQDATTDQMIDLYYVANKLGFYDAADYIKNVFIDNTASNILNKRCTYESNYNRNDGN